MAGAAGAAAYNAAIDEGTDKDAASSTGGHNGQGGVWGGGLSRGVRGG